MHRFIAAVIACGAVTTAAVTLPSATPDYSLPPGAFNPAVTQATIRSTVCVHGWTKTVRPPTSYTSALKLKQMKARHLPGAPTDYELDHFIPLALGGAPADPSNLWPEPWTQAHAKDFAEVHLQRAVCAGTITLEQAQRQIRNPAIWHKTIDP